MPLKILYPTPESVATDPIAVDVIAIHGLDGDLITTWTHLESQSCWLRDFLPQDLSYARIMTFGYDAAAAFGKSKADIDDHGSRLLSSIIDKRETSDEKKRPIIFVAHSLGGIIVKQALRQSSLEVRYKELKESTIGLVFLGTPHQGSQHADYCSVLASAAAKVLHRPDSHIVEALKSNNAFLLGLSKDFRHMIDDYSIVSCYEGRTMSLTRSLVVEKHSAVLEHKVEEQIPVDADHVQMCKFANRDDDTYEKLYKRMARMVRDHTQRQQAQQLTLIESRNVYYNLSHHVSRDFVGRADIGRQLHENCLPTKQQHSQALQKRFVLYGLGGSGKTQISLKFANDHRENFWGIFYVDASSNTALEQGFLDIADDCGLQNYDSKRTKRWLSNARDPWLLILDGADDVNMKLEEHFPGGTRGVILVTTRNLDHKKFATVGFCEIGRLDTDSAITLLLKASIQSLPADDSVRTLANGIVEKLGCLALAIISAAALIRQQVCNFQDYCATFERHRKRLLQNSSKSPQNFAVYATWEASLEAVTSIRTETAEIALELLNIFSYLHFEGISDSIFEAPWDLFESQQPALPKSSIYKELFSYAIKSLKLFEHGKDRSACELEYRQALSLLTSFSLVSHDRNDAATSLHPLVHCWIRDRHTTYESALWATKCMILLLMTLATGTTRMSYRISSRVKMHITACLHDHVDTSSLSDDDLKTHVLAVDESTNILRDCGHAIDLFERAESAARSVYLRWGPDDIFALITRRLLADRYHRKGDTMRALMMYTNVYKTVEQYPPSECPEEISDLGLLESCAHCFETLEYFEHARKLQERVVRFAMVRIGDRAPRTMESKAILALMCRSAGRKQRAMELGEEVFAWRKRNRGVAHFDTVGSAKNLAHDCFTLGLEKRSLELCEFLAEQCLQEPTNQHPCILQHLHFTAQDFFRLKFKDKAHALTQLLVNTSQEVLGQDHPQTKKRESMLRCFTLLIQVAKDNDAEKGSLSLVNLGKLSAMITDIIGPINQKANKASQDSITQIQKVLLNNDQQPLKASARKEIERCLEIVEYNFLVPKVFAELEHVIQVEATVFDLSMTEESLAAQTRGWWSEENDALREEAFTGLTDAERNDQSISPEADDRMTSTEEKALLDLVNDEELLVLEIGALDPFSGSERQSDEWISRNLSQMFFDSI